ncbi:MAG: hypothetical protein ACKOQ3_02860 [Novosphingobium sp.]
MIRFALFLHCFVLALAVSLGAAPALADSLPAAANRTLVPSPNPGPTYADLVDLADGAPLVVRAQVRKAVALDAARARGVRPGWIRAYVEARTEALIGGSRPLGEKLVYLVDVRADAKGRLPKLGKQSVILFARDVSGRPGELQLIAPDAQLPWSAPLEAQVKGVLGELFAADAPQRITGVREALHVSGTLAGEGETQLFLTSANGEPAALTVSRQPGQAPQFSASFSELVGAAGGLPQRGTLAWYRLACFLPGQLPARANIADAVEDRAAAALDYAAVIEQLGACPRSRR